MSTHVVDPAPPAARVQPILLALSALLVPILTIAFLILYLFPATLGADLFAWPVTPTMSAMMLGATYLGGAYFFVVVLRSRQWRHVRLGFLPITVFAGTLGLATLFHWDRFVHDRLGFQLWATLYFAVPVALPVLWYRNQRIAGADRRGELSRASRFGLAVQGVVLAVAGLLLFLVPELMATIWPWTITALTGRMMAAIFLLPGLVGLGIAYDGSWSGSRYLLQAEAFTLVLMLAAVGVARGDFDWGRPVSWLFVGGLVAVLALIGYAYATRTEST